MEITTKLHDDFGNTATIEEKTICPYRGAAHKEKSFILSLTADYDNNFMYYRSVFDNMDDLMSTLRMYSCNTWK